MDGPDSHDNPDGHPACSQCGRPIRSARVTIEGREFCSGRCKTDWLRAVERQGGATVPIGVPSPQTRSMPPQPPVSRPRPAPRPVTASQPVLRPPTGSQPVLRPPTGSQPVLRPATGPQTVPRPATGPKTAPRPATGPHTVPRPQTGPPTVQPASASLEDAGDAGGFLADDRAEAEARLEDLKAALRDLAVRECPRCRQETPSESAHCVHCQSVLEDSADFVAEIESIKLDIQEHVAAWRAKVKEARVREAEAREAGRASRREAREARHHRMGEVSRKGYRFKKEDLADLVRRHGAAAGVKIVPTFRGILEDRDARARFPNLRIDDAVAGWGGGGIVAGVLSLWGIHHDYPPAATGGLKAVLGGRKNEGRWELPWGRLVDLAWCGPRGARPVPGAISDGSDLGQFEMLLTEMGQYQADEIAGGGAPLRARATQLLGDAVGRDPAAFGALFQAIREAILDTPAGSGVPIDGVR